ncbi:S41 family peptidase [Ahrensia sp. R2A130]|uniref:S41 family peptidase n=1 Tax=Ahrensia sp. R2A130 TaxID=744979 RepID=UPI0001E09455|nr:S41 family peptidase [Ahrensia sp. R2A130]EFL89592.1 carboxy--processing protease [Ahrensia sp. R2A130]
MIRRVSMLMAGVAIGATSLLAVQTGLGFQSSADAAGSETYKQLDIFGDVFERIRSQYVTEPKEEELIKSAINGMLKDLDPHSGYLDLRESRSMQTQTKGEFGGLGIEVTMEDELIKVIAPIDDTPAAKAGVLSGDLVSQIDGVNVRGLSLQEGVDKMRGLINTPIVLTILRKGADKPMKITIVRDKIVLKSVKSRVIDGDVGYLDVNGFTEQTLKGLKEAIAKIREEVKDEDLKGYVVDLRLNPGGLLGQAIGVSDSFLNRGEIVSTRGRAKGDVQRNNATPGDLTRGKPVIVLINGGSASASEIVAGALQDHRRATVIGTRSFGKGSVQTIIPLGNDKGALRITTALYYTPSGCSIQGKGIDPDIIIDQPLPVELQGRVEARGESNLRNSIEGESQDDSGSGSFAYVPPDPKDDLQLNHALDLLRGIKKDASFPPATDEVLNSKDCKRV